MKNEVAVLYSEEEIARRVVALGHQISQDYAGRGICVLGLMKGSLVFMADLVRQIRLDLTMHVLKVTSQHERTSSRLMTEISYSTAVPLECRDVLLLVDIVDTGVTLSYLLGHIHELAPRSLRVCTLVDKPYARKIGLHPDWSAFSLAEPLGDRFLVGYGLDHEERYRGLPYIGTIERGAAPA